MEIAIDDEHVVAIIRKAEQTLDELAADTAAAMRTGESLVALLANAPDAAGRLRVLGGKQAIAVDSALAAGRESLRAMQSALDYFRAFEAEAVESLEAVGGATPGSARGFE